MLNSTTAPMPSAHPFHHLFESLERLPQFHAEGVNQGAFQGLIDTLAVPADHAGRCVLLRAPRAGYGKTHLLSRLQHRLVGSHEFIPLIPIMGSRVDASTITGDVLRRIARPLPGGDGLLVLDVIVRRLFALALEPLVKSGDVPCVDREGALTSLRVRPVETFDFHEPTAITAGWIRDHFEVLGPRFALELAQLTGANPRAMEFWVETWFRFAVAPFSPPGRVDALVRAVSVSPPDDGLAMERLAALLASLALLTRVVLVADDLEGFSADETAALRLAVCLSSLRHAVERLDVILSVNRDIWESAFVPRLSGGLLDRLSEVVIELDGLTEAQMIAVLDSRAAGFGRRVVDFLRPNGLETYSRGLLRAAGAAWWSAVQESETHRSAAVAHPVSADAETTSFCPEGTPPLWQDPSVNATAGAGEAEVGFAGPEWATPVVSSPIAELATASPTALDWHDVTGPTAPFDLPQEPFAEPAVPIAESRPIDHDRVEDLLRQFRERYQRPKP